MDTKTTDLSPKDEPKDSTLGISFNEVHTDEPQNDVTANETEIAPRYTSNDSHLTNHDDVFNVTKAFSGEHVETGTIVSDRRKQRPSLMSNLRSAFDEWWQKTHNTISKTLDEIPTVDEEEQKPVLKKSETRAEVVKRAVSPEKLAPKDDHVVVVEKIRTFKQDVARVTGTPVVIKEPEKKKTEWSHVVTPVKKEVEKVLPKNTAPLKTTLPDFRHTTVAPLVNNPAQYEIKKEAPLKQAPEVPVQKPIVPAPVVEQKKTPLPPLQVPSTVSKKSIPRPINPVVITPTVTISVPGLHQTPVPKTPQEPVKPTWQPPIEKSPAPVQTPEQPQTSAINSRFRSTPAPIPSVEQKPAPNVAQQTTEDRNKEQAHLPVPSDTVPASRGKLYIRWILIGTMIVLGIVLAVVVSMNSNFFNVPNTSESETSTPPEQPIVQDPQSMLLFTNGKQEFLQVLKSHIATAPQGLTQFFPVVPEGTSVRHLTADEFLSLLSVNLPGKVIRALDDTFIIGSITTTVNEPFIVIRSYNFDVLFAGMLAWEPTLLNDLSPLFTAMPLTQTSYTDTVQQNLPTRVLYADGGKEVVVYAFVDAHTVVITTSSAGLSRVIEQL